MENTQPDPMMSAPYQHVFELGKEYQEQLVGHSLDALLFLCILTALVLLFFRFMPKANRPTHFFLWGMAFLASIPIFAPGIGLFTDAEFHLIRIDAIYEGLKTGQFPVRLSGIFNLNHGLPVNIFYGDWLLYFPALLRFCGFSLSESYQFFVFSIQLLSVYLAYFCFIRIFQKRTLALLVTLAYILSHYRLASFYMRTAVGEFSALTFAPLILLAFWRIYTAPTPHFNAKSSILLALGATGMLCSHMITTVLTALCCTLVALFGYRRTFSLAVLKTYALGILLTLLLSAAFWIPFLDYYFSTFINLRALTTDTLQFMQANGYPLLYYFPFFHFGSLSSTQFSITPGLLLLSTFAVALYWVLFQSPSYSLKAIFALSTILLWASSAYFPWDALTSLPFFTLLATLQVPWRFLSIEVLILALLLGILIENLPSHARKNAICLAFFIGLFQLALIYSNFVREVTLQEVPNAYTLRNFTGTDDPELRNSSPEYLIYGTDLKQLSYSLHFAHATGHLVAENGITMALYVDNVGQNAFVEIPRFFYPYLEAFTPEARPLESVMGNNNLMRILLPEHYQGLIIVRFLPPLFWRLAECLSLLTGIFLLIFISKKRKKMQKSTVGVSFFSNF